MKAPTVTHRDAAIEGQVGLQDKAMWMETVINPLLTYENNRETTLEFK